MGIWAGIVDQEGVRDAFKLPQSVLPVAFIPLGYASDDYTGNPAHHDRKPLEEIVKYL